MMLLLLLHVACLAPVLMDTGLPGAPGDTAVDTSETGDTADTADTGDTGETGDTADTGHTGETGDTSETGDPCGEGTGICELTVADATLVFDDAGDPHTIAATPNGPGHLDVVVQHFANGCCPDLDVSGIVSLGDMNIRATIVLGNDDCDCVAALGATFTLGGIPPGSYTLTDGVATTNVAVE